MNEKLARVRVEQQGLTNSLQLAALMQLLEEKGILKQNEVLGRISKIMDERATS